nr:hypothetical protein 1573p1_00026 [Serratia marcescens]
MRRKQRTMALSCCGIPKKNDGWRREVNFDLQLL